MIDCGLSREFDLSEPAFLAVPPQQVAKDIKIDD
jgi:hypothetical protein